MISRALYRLRQGLANLRAAVGDEDRSFAMTHLSEAEGGLFLGMETADQRHSIRVLQRLLSTGIDDRDLLKAALLHDVGKSYCRIGILHRTAAVALKALLGRLPAWLADQPRARLRRPFYVLQNHPRLGADLLARAGCSERVCRLAELHQSNPHLVGSDDGSRWTRWALATLRLADNEN
jgi:hypothetical protein